MVELFERYENIIQAISHKYTNDPDIREDCQQNARIALSSLDIERIRRNKDAYCRKVIRNTVLSTLSSYTTGEWYTGRTVAGEKQYPRYQRIDHLLESGAVQIDTHGNIFGDPRVIVRSAVTDWAEENNQW